MAYLRDVVRRERRVLSWLCASPAGAVYRQLLDTTALGRREAEFLREVDERLVPPHGRGGNVPVHEWLSDLVESRVRLHEVNDVI